MAGKESEVIVFKEPLYNRPKSAARERNLFLRGNVSEIFSSNIIDSGKNKRLKTEANSSVSVLNIQDTLREVQSLAVSSLTGKSKRRFEEDQIRSLGAKPPKPNPVSFRHYLTVTKVKQEKERKLAEELKVSHKKVKRTKSTMARRGKGHTLRSKGRWKDNMKSLEPLGRFKNGVLTLRSRDLRKNK